MSKSLEIITEPNKILRTKSVNIEKITSYERSLMDSMLSSMYESKGCGLAAIQVAVPKRIMVLDTTCFGEEEKEMNKIDGPLFIVNPKIIKFSKDLIDLEEGCLSVPEQKISVRRPKDIELEYLDYNGDMQNKSFYGWTARVVQHEHDHMEGKLIIDYLSKFKRDIAIRRLNKLKRII